MLNGEIGANKGKEEAAVKAKEINIDEERMTFLTNPQEMEPRHTQ